MKPLTYFCFSSSFICSARSRPVPPPAEIPDVDSGVPPLDAGTWSLVLLADCFSDPEGMMRGEFAMVSPAEDGEVLIYLICYNIPSLVDYVELQRGLLSCFKRFEDNVPP